jgi:hypothetical protein
MINDPFHPEEAIAREKESTKRKFLGVVCAVGVTAILLAGYAYIKRFHARQVIANQQVVQPVESGPKGPPLAHVLIDEASIEKGSTTVGGVVKNISERELSGVSIALELHRRAGGSEQKLVSVAPVNLQPNQEGAYSLRLSASEYGSVKFLGVRADPQSEAIAYTSAPGKKRALERLEPKVIVVKRPGKPGDFINTPDNPTKVP